MLGSSSTTSSRASGRTSVFTLPMVLALLTLLATRSTSCCRSTRTGACACACPGPAAAEAATSTEPAEATRATTLSHGDGGHDPVAAGRTLHHHGRARGQVACLAALGHLDGRVITGRHHNGAAVGRRQVDLVTV